MVVLYMTPEVAGIVAGSAQILQKNFPTLLKNIK